MQILDHGKGYGRTVLCKYANSDWLSKIKRQCLTANNATEASLNRLRIDAIKLHRLDKNLSAVNIDLTPDDLSEIIEAMYTRKGHNLAFLPEVAQLKSARREYNYQASVGFNRKNAESAKFFSYLCVFCALGG